LMSRLRRLCCLPLLLLLVALPPANCRVLHAADVRMKNKMVLHGVPTPLESLIVNKPSSKKEDPEAIKLYPILMVTTPTATTPLKRYFISVRQADDVNKDVPLSK